MLFYCSTSVNRRSWFRRNCIDLVLTTTPWPFRHSKCASAPPGSNLFSFFMILRTLWLLRLILVSIRNWMENVSRLYPNCSSLSQRHCQCQGIRRASHVERHSHNRDDVRRHLGVGSLLPSDLTRTFTADLFLRTCRAPWTR